MEWLGQLWQGYWWLVFPLGAGAVAVAGKIGSAWERAAKRRHTQRLELLKAKAELKAISRGRSPIAQRVTDAVDAGMGTASGSSGESQATQLARLFATHDGVTARWLDYELDVAKLIAFPAMSDGRQPLTAAFLRAQRVADGLRPASPKTRLTPAELSEYRNAVADYEVAFDVAERDARRLRDSTFSDAERKRLETAKQLLSIAIDQAATPAERQIAYRRVREELDGLISLSDDAIEVLETRVALELAATTDAATSDAAAGPVPAASAPDRDGPAAPPPNPRPSATPPGAPAAKPWPVPARGADTAPGRVTRPKPHV